MVDSIFIGHGVGSMALAALGISFPLMNIGAAFGAAVGIGGSTLMSLRLGQRQYDKANNVLGNMVALNIITGLLLPVGISFFTFQSLSYTIDVYRGDVKPTRDVVAFGVFIAFFPQLVAGPIVLYSEMIPGGYVNVTRNPEGLDSKVSIEVLFNTVMKNKETIKQIFS